MSNISRFNHNRETQGETDIEVSDAVIAINSVIKLPSTWTIRTGLYELWN